MVGWVPPGLTPGYSKPFPGFAPLWHMCSLLRDVRYDARFKQLITPPIAEYKALRTGLAGSLPPNTSAQPGVFLPFGAGRQLDLEVVFALPSADTDSGRMCVDVLRSADGAHTTQICIERGLPTPPPSNTPVYAHYMPSTDLPGDDLYYYGVNYTEPRLCEAACAANSTCKAWTFVAGQHESKPYPVPRCCFKSPLPRPRKAPPTITSGVINLPPVPPPPPPTSTCSVHLVSAFLHSFLQTPY